MKLQSKFLISITIMFFISKVCRGYLHPTSYNFVQKGFARLSPAARIQLPQHRSLWMTLTDENNDRGVRPTWEYKPYDPSYPQRRRFSEWKIPNTITIPEDRLELSFVRSSGAGGQNVNKVNTQVEVRFRVMDAGWIPEEVRERLMEQQSNRINKEGFMTLSSQEYRTQQQNRKAVVSKLRQFILEAYPRPKERKMRKGISKASKQRNKEDKKRRGNVKASRRRVDF